MNGNLSKWNSVASFGTGLGALRADKAGSAPFAGGGQPFGRRKKIRRRQKCLFKDVYFTSKRRSELALASASSCSGLAGNLPRR